MPRVDNRKFYNLAISKYKITAQGVHWASKERQEIRFEKFYTLLADTLAHSTIVDAGCGFGDFYHFLKAKGALPRCYIGVDVHKKMVKISRKQTRQTIICADILHDKLPRADYYVCSGAMNILHPFETQMFIQKMFDASQKGVVFNILKGQSHEDDIYNKFTGTKLKQMLNHLSARIEFYEDYLDDDLTVMMSKAS